MPDRETRATLRSTFLAAALIGASMGLSRTAHATPDERLPPLALKSTWGTPGTGAGSFGEILSIAVDPTGRGVIRARSPSGSVAWAALHDERTRGR